MLVQMPANSKHVMIYDVIWFYSYLQKKLQWRNDQILKKFKMQQVYTSSLTGGNFI